MTSCTKTPADSSHARDVTVNKRKHKPNRVLRSNTGMRPQHSSKQSIPTWPRHPLADAFDLIERHWGKP